MRVTYLYSFLLPTSSDFYALTRRLSQRRLYGNHITKSRTYWLTERTDVGSKRRYPTLLPYVVASWRALSPAFTVWSSVPRLYTLWHLSCCIGRPSLGRRSSYNLACLEAWWFVSCFYLFSFFFFVLFLSFSCLFLLFFHSLKILLSLCADVNDVTKWAL